MSHRSFGPANAVPLLDIRRQNARLTTEFQTAMGRVCETAAFVHGPACGELEAAIAEFCEVPAAVGCASGSDALLLALMALDVGPGDEVIVPSFTFFATAGVVWRLGAEPVFADIDPVTFNIDPKSVAAKITPQTRVIIPVHLFGQCADMDPLLDLAAEHGLAVVEDAAQAIGARYRGRPAGSMGTLGCISFYPTKNLGAFGDGGMLTVREEELAQRLRSLRDHGQEPRYIHHVVGMNSRLDTLQAAVLNVKLPRLERWQTKRGEHAAFYAEQLDHLHKSQQLMLPQVDSRCESVWNQYTVRVPGGQRDALRDHLTRQNIGSAIYYPQPLHLQPCFRNLGYAPGSLPNTELVCREVLSLPIFAELTEAELGRVVDAIDVFMSSVQHRVDPAGLSHPDSRVAVA